MSQGCPLPGGPGKEPVTAHLQQLLEAEDLGHQDVLLTAQLLPLQPLPLRLLVCLRELAVEPARGEQGGCSASHDGCWGWVPSPVLLAPHQASPSHGSRHQEGRRAAGRLLETCC